MSDIGAAPILYSVQDEVAILRIDYPPVNALWAAVREGLVARIGEAGR